MNNNYLKAFVIASSALVFFPHYFAVATADKAKLNYSYEQYTFIAPVYYGLMNMLSLYFALLFNLTSRQRYLIVGTISPLIVISVSFFFKTYTYEKNEWIQYSLGLFLKHFLIWNIVVFLLDKYV
jgi:hypothetical protein